MQRYWPLALIAAGAVFLYGSVQRAKGEGAGLDGGPVKVEGIVLGPGPARPGHGLPSSPTWARVDLLTTLRTWWPVSILIVWGGFSYEALAARARGRNLPAAEARRFD